MFWTPWFGSTVTGSTATCFDGYTSDRILIKYLRSLMESNCLPGVHRSAQLQLRESLIWENSSKESLIRSEPRRIRNKASWTISSVVLEFTECAYTECPKSTDLRWRLQLHPAAWNTVSGLCKPWLQKVPQGPFTTLTCARAIYIFRGKIWEVNYE